MYTIFVFNELAGQYQVVINTATSLMLPEGATREDYDDEVLFNNRTAELEANRSRDLPNFEGFYQEFEHTAIDDAMGDTIASNDWLRLNIRISKILDRGGLTEEDKFVIQYLWNSVIDGLENPLDAEMVNQLKEMAEKHHLTGVYQILDNGKLMIV